MRNVANLFVRWFNRRRRRDGPRFRGRFLSRCVESESFWWTLVRYVDFNPVRAQIVLQPLDYPHGSASRYGHVGPRPRWLTRDRIEKIVMEGSSGSVYRPERYSKVFSDPPTDREAELVERRMRQSFEGADPLDDLLGAGPEKVRAWQLRKCDLADGTGPGLPIITPGTVLDLVESMVEVPHASRLILAAGRMRLECGLALREIGERTGCSEATVLRRVREHSRPLAGDPGYAERSALLLAPALTRDHAPRRHL